MEFTADQYLALAVTLLLAIGIMLFGYLIGRADSKKLVNQYKTEYRLQSTAHDAQRKSLARARQENDHLREQAASLAEVVLELQSRTVITVQQKDQISRSARQLSMCAELMSAMSNHENAKTQRLLASQLYDIVQQKEQIQEQGAAA